MNQEAVLGIDVSKAKLDVCLEREGRKCQRTYANSRQGFEQLVGWLNGQQLADVHICLEATGLYGEALAQFVYEAGYRVSVVNPKRIKSHAETLLSRNKTDKGDAALIADFCRRHEPKPWEPAPLEQQELQMLSRHLRRLGSMRQQERNRLQSGLSSPTVCQVLRDHIDFLTHQIGQLEQHIQDHIDQHSTLKEQRDLLASIPGIGHKTAAILLAEVRDFLAFDNVRELVAFAGLNPSLHQSGTSVYARPRISRQGNAALRAALYWPAISACHSNPLIQPLSDRLVADGHPKMVAIVAAMRKLLHLAYGVLKSRIPFDPAYLSKSACSP